MRMAAWWNTTSTPRIAVASASGAAGGGRVEHPPHPAHRGRERGAIFKTPSHKGQRKPRLDVGGFLSPPTNEVVEEDAPPRFPRGEPFGDVRSDQPRTAG